MPLVEKYWAGENRREGRTEIAVQGGKVNGPHRHRRLPGQSQGPFEVGYESWENQSVTLYFFYQDLAAGVQALKKVHACVPQK